MDPFWFKLLRTTLKNGLAANFNYLFESAVELETNQIKVAPVENWDKIRSY